MKTDTYISAECIKNNTNPRFSISDVTATIGKATYDRPYDYTFLPVPTPYYPVSTKFDYCMGESSAADNGVPFRVMLPPDFSHEGKTNLIVNISGDKFFRYLYSYSVLLEDWSGNDYIYQTETWIRLTHIMTLANYMAETSNANKLARLYTQRFWRCCIEKDASKYRSAWTNVVSFNLGYRIATTGVGGHKEDATPVADETGLLYDGQYYW